MTKFGSLTAFGVLFFTLVPCRVGSVETGPTNRFLFRTPAVCDIRLDALPVDTATGERWLRSGSGPEMGMEFGSRVVLQMVDRSDASAIASVYGLKNGRELSAGIWLFDSTDAWGAARSADALAKRPEIFAAYPVVRARGTRDFPFAAAPNDFFFQTFAANVVGQWYLENRDATAGHPAGPDINVRGAWPFARGAGVTVAIADGGMELSHADLKDRTDGSLHWNFSTSTTNATPTGNDSHGTACAGLVAATGDNGLAMSGVAPLARLASWRIFDTQGNLVSDDRLFQAFTYSSNSVAVQNHSWSRNYLFQSPLTLLEDAGIEAATSAGRGGKGVVMVRSAGNFRGQGASASDDPYANDPRVVAVGAINRDGRVASYSEPGACVLVAAPSGDAGRSGLFTTDLTGTAGVNQINYFPPFEYLSDFMFNSIGFSGTSASAPLVSGISALLLSANTNLTVRDVQQILVLSSRHFDRNDPFLGTNAAGLVFSRNTGFGVPDAGAAMRLARSWAPVGPMQTITIVSNSPVAIPDAGLRLIVSGADVPPDLQSVIGLPALGPHADSPTLDVALVDSGLGTSFAGIDVQGRAALMQRGGNDFSAKLNLAAAAGAKFGIVYNFATNTNPDSCPGGDQLCLPGGTDFTTIPGLFIGYTNGLRLKGLFSTNAAARVRLQINPAVQTFSVTNQLRLEHVGVRIVTDHPVRGDLNITVVSPNGTRSILQRYNSDVNPGPVDWTFWTVHHFGESPVGQWRVEITDEGQDATGSLLSASLVLRGAAIEDADADGLDDGWEHQSFGNLSQGPKDDPDKDGLGNAREQMAGSNPATAENRFRIEATPWNSQMFRLSWPGNAALNYGVWSGTDPAALSLQSTTAGKSPENAVLIPMNTPSRFFQIRTNAP